MGNERQVNPQIASRKRKRPTFDLAVNRDREPSSEANFVTRLRGAKFAIEGCTVQFRTAPSPGAQTRRPLPLKEARS